MGEEATPFGMGGGGGGGTPSGFAKTSLLVLITARLDLADGEGGFGNPLTGATAFCEAASEARENGRLFPGDLPFAEAPDSVSAEAFECNVSSKRSVSTESEGPGLVVENRGGFPGGGGGNPACAEGGSTPAASSAGSGGLGPDIRATGDSGAADPCERSSTDSSSGGSGGPGSEERKRCDAF